VEIHDDVTTTNNKMEGKTVVVEDNETCDDNINNSKQHHYHLDSNPIIPLRAHPDDSISDLKRHIQSNYADTWGLDGQRLDRDGLHLGWELVHCGNNNGLNNDFSSGGSGTSNDGGDMDVLSYHLFVHSCGIRNGDVLHAVVKRRDESSSHNRQIVRGVMFSLMQLVTGFIFSVIRLSFLHWGSPLSTRKRHVIIKNYTEVSLLLFDSIL